MARMYMPCRLIAPILSNCTILSETSCDASLQQDVLTNRSSSSSSSPYLTQLVVQVTAFLQLQCIKPASKEPGGLTKPLELASCCLLERRQEELVNCESAILGAANDVLLQYVETASGNQVLV